MSIVDVVELEEEACIRLIIHAELVLTTPVMEYESRASHSRYKTFVLFLLYTNLLFNIFHFKCKFFLLFFICCTCNRLSLHDINFAEPKNGDLLIIK